MKNFGTLLKANKYYLLFYTVFLIIGLAIVSIIEKGNEILWANTFHSDQTDQLYLIWTQVGEEVAFIGVLIILLFIQIRKALYIPILGLLVTFISFVLKLIFSHPRPSSYLHDLGLFESLHKVDFVHIIQSNNSFPSGHTMAGFALFTYLAFCVRSEWVKMICLILALGVGYSRIYLIQHFLVDVCFGSFCGVLLAIFVYLIQQSLFTKEKSVLNRPIYEIAFFSKQKRNRA